MGLQVLWRTKTLQSQYIFFCECEDVWPPSIALQITEGAIDEAGSELSGSDEEGVHGHELPSEVRRRGLSDVHRHCHRGNTCTAQETGTLGIKHTTVQGYIQTRVRIVCYRKRCTGMKKRNNGEGTSGVYIHFVTNSIEEKMLMAKFYKWDQCFSHLYRD